MKFNLLLIEVLRSLSIFNLHNAFYCIILVYCIDNSLIWRLLWLNTSFTLLYHINHCKDRMINYKIIFNFLGDQLASEFYSICMEISMFEV